MRVLTTGMSPPQCGRPTQTGYEHVSDLWAKALRAGGAQVEHRTVEPGESLTDYDVVLVGLIPPNSIANRYLYTAFDIIARARQSGCGLVLYVDDWRFGQIVNGVRVVQRNPDKRLFDNAMFKNLFARDWAIDQGRALIVAVLNALQERPWPTTVIPAFAWGDHTKLPELPARAVEVIDPSVFAREYEIPYVDDDSRQRAWVMGTFSDQREWIESQKLTWDTDYIGTRRSQAARRLKEHELVASYGHSWGVMAAPYGHAGSGWWRNRFVYSALAGSIMLADPREVAGLGPDYHKPASEIEMMTTSQLREFAHSQGRLITHFEEPAEQVTTRLTGVLQTAIDEIDAALPVAS